LYIVFIYYFCKTIVLYNINLFPAIFSPVLVFDSFCFRRYNSFFLLFFFKCDNEVHPLPGPPNQSTSGKIAAFKIPDKSASVIANSLPETYDVFGHVCRSGTFVPNLRIRDLVRYSPSQESSQELADLFAHGLQYTDTYKHIAGGSEQKLVDPNLQFVLNTVIRIHGGDKCMVAKIVTNRSVLSKSAHGEHCITSIAGKFPQKVLVVTEVKSIEASIEECYSQCTTVCGDAAVDLRRCGLSQEDCVVPGFMMAGTVCQFCAVYLIADMFPVLVMLSDVLSTIGSIEQQLEIAQWHLRLILHAKETVKLLNMPTTVPLEIPRMIQLNVTEMFLKPVRARNKGDTILSDPSLPISSRSSRLNTIMRMYKLMHKGDGLGRNLENAPVLFPIGVLSMPDESVAESKDIFTMIKTVCLKEGFIEPDFFLSPIIAFPLLRDWNNEKPPQRLHASYMVELDNAIAFMNSGKVAHMDLRPANIMWQELTDNAVSMRIIDFEDAVIFTHTIPNDWIGVIVATHDFRYPFRVGDEAQRKVADERYNFFFREAIRRWLDSEENEFREFMVSHGQGIVEEIFPLQN
jgi:hypothetical protein